MNHRIITILTVHVPKVTTNLRTSIMNLHEQHISNAQKQHSKSLQV